MEGGQPVGPGEQGVVIRYCASLVPAPVPRADSFEDDPRTWAEWRNLERRVTTAEGYERERMLNRLAELLSLARWQHRTWGVL